MNLLSSIEAQLLFSAASNGPRWEVNLGAERVSFSSAHGFVAIDAHFEDFGQIVARVHGMHPDAATVAAWALSELIGDPREAVADRQTPTLEVSLSKIVAEALGVNPWKVSPAKRAELIARVADGLWLASRARVECERPGTYNMGKGKTETVKIAAAPLLLQRLDMDAARPIVEIALSPAWRRNSTGKLAQFLPVGEAFENLSSARPSGALARSLVLWIVTQARIHRADALGGCLKPFKPSEALERFGANLPDFGEGHQSRLIDAWADALRQLVEINLIAPTADASELALRQRLGVVKGGGNAAEKLLSEPVALQVGPVLRDALEALERCGDCLKVARLLPKSGEVMPKSGEVVEGNAPQEARSNATGVGSGYADRSPASPKERPEARPRPKDEGLFGSEAIQ